MVTLESSGIKLCFGVFLFRGQPMYFRPKFWVHGVVCSCLCLLKHLIFKYISMSQTWTFKPRLLWIWAFVNVKTTDAWLCSCSQF